MKKLLAFILVAVMILMAMASCGKGDEPSDGSEDKSSAVSEPDTSGTSSEPAADIYGHLRDIDLGERTIKILVYSGETNKRYQSAEIMENPDNPDILNTAIAERNEFVQNLLNCTIEEVRVNDVLADARIDILGNGEYDIIMPYMPFAATLAMEGSLIDLNEFSDIIRLDADYWDQRANSDLSVAHKLYFSTGDFSLLTFDCTHALVFNKTIVKNTAGMDDPYQLLKDNKWTFDKMYQNAKLATYESDGSDGMTFKDNWGLFMNTNYCTTMFISAGERLTEKDSNDYPYMAPTSTRAASVVEKIREIFTDPNSTIQIESYVSTLAGAYPDVYYAATAATGENRALFRSLSIVDLKELSSDFDSEYGILPNPKYDENQEEYYNIVSAILASCICIHNQVEDPDASAAVAEALAASSTDTVKKNYYEIVLKARKFPDDDGEFALDLIFNNRVYEPAVIYSFGSLNTFINDCASATTNIYSSRYDAIQSEVTTKIQEVIDTFENFG